MNANQIETLGQEIDDDSKLNQEIPQQHMFEGFATESKDARFSFNPGMQVMMYEPSPLFADRRRSKRLESKHKFLMNSQTTMQKEEEEVYVD